MFGIFVVIQTEGKYISSMYGKTFIGSLFTQSSWILVLVHWGENCNQGAKLLITVFWRRKKIYIYWSIRFQTVLSVFGSILARRYIFNDLAQGRFSLVVVMSVCPIARNCWLCLNGLDWKLLVKEYIANIGIPLDIVCRFDDFWCFEILFFVFSGLPKQPT